MSVINTNISALQAQNSLRSTSLNLSTSMERLSTGTRINSAKDDAAGLAISTRMTASIRGISAAIRNANDGISLTQTAEGSLSQIGDNLQRVRELAVQSSNTGNNASDRAAMNNEAKQLIAEIDRVASNTSFNGIKLLDGTFQNQALQVGASNDVNDRISISVGSAKSSALGVGSSSSYKATTSGVNVGSTALAAGALNINGFTTGAATADGVSSAESNTSGIAVAAAINAISAQTNVTATVGQTSLGGTAATGFKSAIAAGDVQINGVSIGPIGAATTAAGRGGQVTAAVNAVSSQTGVTATFDSTTGAIALNAIDGRNITIVASNAGGASNVTGLGSGTALSVSGTAVTSGDAIKAGTVSINGVELGAVAGDGTAVTTNGESTAAKTTDGVSIATQVITQGKALLAAPVVVITTAGTGAVAQEEEVTFKAMTSGQAVTVSGLTFTASKDISATEVAKAFGNLTTGITAAQAQAREGYSVENIKGAYTGTLTTITTGSYSAGQTTANATRTAAGANPTALSVAGSAVGTESSSVTFSDLAVGESTTLNGLKFTATVASTGAQVATAFGALSSGASASAASANSARGTFEGQFDFGYSTAASNNAVVVATASTASANKTDIVLSTSRVAVTESAVISFSALAAGETTTLNGLTFTSTNATSAEDVAKAFASVTSGTLAADLSSTKGAFTGSFTAGYSTGVSTGASVTATSTTSSSQVTDIVVATNGAASAETSVITFNDLSAGESATLNGLTYTSTGASSAKQVAAAFGDITTSGSNIDAASIKPSATGTFSGAFTTGFSTTLNGEGVLKATATSTGDKANISISGKALNVAAAVNAVTDKTGVSASASANGVNLTSNGRAINLTGNNAALTGISDLTAANTSGGTVATTLTDRSKVQLSSTAAEGINVSGSTAAALTASGLSEATMNATMTAGAGISSLDLTTAAGSQAALTTLDSAINTITDSRASMGAYQNRLSASISNLESTSMNLSASRSRILDTDYAKETTNLAKAQIISQAATAMLAQANQSGQSVLALLK
jgi:flagellin